MWLAHARGAGSEHADPPEQAALLAVEATILETEGSVRGGGAGARPGAGDPGGDSPPDHPELVLARHAVAVSHGHA